MKVTINIPTIKHCKGCYFNRRYNEGNWSVDVCSHPNHGRGNYEDHICDYSKDTYRYPKWCPILGDSINEV